MRGHIDVETVIKERKGLCLQLAQMGLSARLGTCTYFIVQILGHSKDSINLFIVNE